MPLSIDVDGWTLDRYTRVQETSPKKALFESQHDAIDEGKHRRMTLGIRNAIFRSPSSIPNSDNVTQDRFQDT